MDNNDYLDAVRRYGPAISTAAGDVGLDADVPSCPGWSAADLVAHTGGILRWAAACVQAPPGGGRVAVPAAPPDGLLDWYDESFAIVLAALVGAPDDLAAWTFFAAPDPKTFWTRRQAHELAMHRADVELARGVTSEYPSDFAADGIDELLNGFLARPRTQLLADPSTSVLVAPADSDAWWHMTINPDGRVTRSSGDRTADLTLRGRASDLYLYLWNREPARPVEIEGDGQVVDLWRERATV